MTDDQDEIRLTLRLPASLRYKILVLANENARSLNAEIVQRLHNSVEHQDPQEQKLEAGLAQLRERVEWLERRVEEHSKQLLRSP